MRCVFSGQEYSWSPEWPPVVTVGTTAALPRDMNNSHKPSCKTAKRHKWTAEGMGGCRENPGVWSLGGTKMRFSHRCIHCGLERHETTYGFQGPTGRDKTEYCRPAREEMADTADFDADQM